MKLIVMALLLALAFGTAQAHYLQGGDENVSVVLFGATRMPNLEDINATTEILKLDVGLIGAENATYQLVEAHNNTYIPFRYKSFSSGKQLAYFLTPKDSLFKLLNVTPTGAKPVYINWWVTPKGSNENLVIRYYGISDWVFNLDEQKNLDEEVIAPDELEQMVVVQFSVENKGSMKQLIIPENFTLMDQWGWPYRPTAGFDPAVVEPQEATSRLLMGFTGISPISRPAALIYDYEMPDQIIIEFERDYVPLSDETVYGANATKSAAPAETLPTVAPPVPDQTAPSETVQPAAKENATAKIGSIKERVAASKARLEATKESLDKKTPDTNENASISSNASNSTSSISA